MDNEPLDRLHGRRSRQNRDVMMRDIFIIDSIIRKRLSSNQQEIDRVEKEIQRMATIIKMNVVPEDVLRAKANLRPLHQTLSDLRAKSVVVYENRVSTVMDKYRQTLTQKTTIDFRARSADNGILIHLFNEFVRNAADFIPSDIIIDRPNTYVCDNCGSTEYIMDDNSVICSVCCAQTTNFVHEESNHEKAPMSKRSYNRRGRFKDAILRKQGKQGKNIPQHVEDAILKHIQHHRLKPEDITEEHINRFLRIEKLKHYYEDSILLWMKFSHKSPQPMCFCKCKECGEENKFCTHIQKPDMCGKCVDILMQDHEQFDKVLPIVLKKLGITRENSLNVDYVLLKFLERHGNVYDFLEYKMFKTRKTIAEHDQIAKECFAELNWVFKNTI